MSCRKSRQVNNTFFIRRVKDFATRLPLNSTTVLIIHRSLIHVPSRQNNFCLGFSSLLLTCHFPHRHGALTGQKIAYIYPDFHTALIGLFVDGVMKEAQEVSWSIFDNFHSDQFSLVYGFRRHERWSGNQVPCVQPPHWTCSQKTDIRLRRDMHRWYLSSCKWAAHNIRALLLNFDLLWKCFWNQSLSRVWT